MFVVVHRPHTLNLSSPKDTCTMLVIGPSLPVLQYLWSFFHAKQPLPRHWQFSLSKLATDHLPCPAWHHGTVHISHVQDGPR